MRTLKFAAFLIFLILIIVSFNSCLNLPDERTKEDEIIEINSYLAKLLNKGYDIDTTAKGVYYVRLEEGEGVLPKQGDTLTVGYAGYFVDGSMFDSSELNNSDGEYEFVFITEPMIPGFEDGLKLMNKGAKFEMIIPSDLAYGETGTMIIPKFAPLIFVVKMLDIKPVAVSE